MQQRQFGLYRQYQPVMAVECHTRHGAEVFVLQKQHGPFAQALLFGGIQAVKDRQLLQDGLPLLGADRVTGNDALATPGSKRPHGLSSINGGAHHKLGVSAGQVGLTAMAQ